jgi:hypothetical protein
LGVKLESSSFLIGAGKRSQSSMIVGVSTTNKSSCDISLSPGNLHVIFSQALNPLRSKLQGSPS